MSDEHPILTHISRQLDELIIVHTMILEVLQIMAADKAQLQQQQARTTKLAQDVSGRLSQRLRRVPPPQTS